METEVPGVVDVRHGAGAQSTSANIHVIEFKPGLLLWTETFNFGWRLLTCLMEKMSKYLTKQH